jgi:hypothetical protein
MDRALLAVLGIVLAPIIIVGAVFIAPILPRPWEHETLAVRVVVKASYVAMSTFEFEDTYERCAYSQAIGVRICGSNIAYRPELNTAHADVTLMNSADNHAVNTLYSVLAKDIQRRGNIAAIEDIKALFQAAGGTMGGGGAACW